MIDSCEGAQGFQAWLPEEAAACEQLCQVKATKEVGSEVQLLALQNKSLVFLLASLLFVHFSSEAENKCILCYC